MMKLTLNKIDQCTLSRSGCAFDSNMPSSSKRISGKVNWMPTRKCFSNHQFTLET